jgi:hypothetical protein
VKGEKYMKKILGFAVGASLTLGIGTYFLAKNPEIFDKVIGWFLKGLSISTLAL